MKNNLDGKKNNDLELVNNSLSNSLEIEEIEEHEIANNSLIVRAKYEEDDGELEYVDLTNQENEELKSSISLKKVESYLQEKYPLVIREANDFFISNAEEQLIKQMSKSNEAAKNFASKINNLGQGVSGYASESFNDIGRGLKSYFSSGSDFLPNNIWQAANEYVASIYEVNKSFEQEMQHLVLPKAAKLLLSKFVNESAELQENAELVLKQLWRSAKVESFLSVITTISEELSLEKDELYQNVAKQLSEHSITDIQKEAVKEVSQGLIKYYEKKTNQQDGIICQFIADRKENVFLENNEQALSITNNCHFLLANDLEKIEDLRLLINNNKLLKRSELNAKKDELINYSTSLNKEQNKLRIKNLEIAFEHLTKQVDNYNELKNGGLKLVENQHGAVRGLVHTVSLAFEASDMIRYATSTLFRKFGKEAAAKAISSSAVKWIPFVGAAISTGLDVVHEGETKKKEQLLYLRIFLYNSIRNLETRVLKDHVMHSNEALTKQFMNMYSVQLKDRELKEEELSLVRLQAVEKTVVKMLKKRAQKYQNDLDEKVDLISRRDNEIIEFKGTVSNLEDRQKELEKDIKSKEGELKKMQKSKDSTEVDLANKGNEIEDLKNQLIKLNEFQKENEKLLQAKEKLELRVIHLETRKEEITQRIRDFEEKYAHFSDEDLKTEAIFLISAWDLEKKQNESLLRSFENRVNGEKRKIERKLDDKYAGDLAVKDSIITKKEGEIRKLNVEVAHLEKNWDKALEDIQKAYDYAGEQQKKIIKKDEDLTKKNEHINELSKKLSNKVKEWVEQQDETAKYVALSYKNDELYHAECNSHERTKKEKDYIDRILHESLADEKIYKKRIMALESAEYEQKKENKLKKEEITKPWFYERSYYWIKETSSNYYRNITTPFKYTFYCVVTLAILTVTYYLKRIFFNKKADTEIKIVLDTNKDKDK